jgi:hypothetical protein
MKRGLVAAALIIGMGCGNKGDKERPDPIKEKVKTEAAALFARANQLVTSPPVASPKPIAPIAAIDDVSLIVSSDPAETRALLAHELGASGNETWWQTKAFGENQFLAQLNDAHTTSFRDAAAWLAKLKYIVVLTSVDYDKPHKNPAGDFHRGHRTVVAQIYGYPSGEYQGAVKFTAKSSVVFEHTGDANAALEAELRNLVGSELVKAAAAGGPAIHTDWKTVTGAGVAVELPAGFTAQPLDPKSVTTGSGPMLMATVGEGNAMEQAVFLFHETDRTAFASAPECTEAIARYATDLKGTAKSAVLDNGTCLGTIAVPQQADARLRYWTQDGKKYSIFCEAQPGKADVAAQCDDVWASRRFL